MFDSCTSAFNIMQMLEVRMFESGATALFKHWHFKHWPWLLPLPLCAKVWSANVWIVPIFMWPRCQRIWTIIRSRYKHLEEYLETFKGSQLFSGTLVGEHWSSRMNILFRFVKMFFGWTHNRGKSHTHKRGMIVPFKLRNIWKQNLSLT